MIKVIDSSHCIVYYSIHWYLLLPDLENNLMFQLGLSQITSGKIIFNKFCIIIVNVIVIGVDM